MPVLCSWSWLVGLVVGVGCRGWLSGLVGDNEKNLNQGFDFANLIFYFSRKKCKILDSMPVVGHEKFAFFANLWGLRVRK